jgi:hypothetical protein
MATRVVSFCVLAALLTGCGASIPDGDDDGGDDAASIDARTIDAPVIDAEVDAPPSLCDWECVAPAPDGCGPVEICNNGLDDDCNDAVDEGCHCPSGAVQSCFRGAPGLRDIGACVDGTQTCQGSGTSSAWGRCTGGISPGDESCDSQDNDCDGCVDDDPTCCIVDLACPGPRTLPDGSPFQPYVLDGTTFYAGTVTAWSWTVTGGPCDQLFVGQGKPPSFTLAGQTTSHLTITPKLSGDLTVTLTMTLIDGSTRECTFIVHIAGPGMRVELCWDTTPNTDLDLHLHRPATTTPWFRLADGTINPDDCNYQNCKPESFGMVADWGYPNTPQASCAPGTPAAGCRNPRLDLDNISVNALPENINVDVPENGGIYRVLVHHYGGTVVTHPMVDVYCGGRLKATYGQAPDLVDGFVSGGGGAMGPMWRVVDITPVVTDGVTTDCTVTMLHPPDQTAGYWVTVNDISY